MPWTRPREIVLIRHAESLRNQLTGDQFALPDQVAQRQLASLTDVTMPLTSEGWVQARRSSVPLIREIGFPDCVYHSGYQRAMETLEGLLSNVPISDRNRIRIYEKIELSERDPGYTWGMMAAEVEQHFPWYGPYYRSIGRFRARPPGGESIAQLATGRVHSMIGTVIRDRPGEVVWFICHGHVMRALRFNFERIPLAEVEAMVREPIPNVAVTRYVYEEDSERPVRTHLNLVYWPQ